MGNTIAIVLMVASVGVFVAVALQIHQFLRGRTIISARQLGLRIVCGVLLLVILAMIYYGLAHDWSDPVQALIFWAVLLFLAVLLFVVAFMDYKETTAIAGLRQAKLYTSAVKNEIKARKRRGNPNSES